MAGSNREIRTAMIAITRISSISVKASGRLDTSVSARMNGTRLKRLVIDWLTVGAMAEPAINIRIDSGFHEPHRAIAEREIGSIETVLAAESADKRGGNLDRAGSDQVFDCAWVLVSAKEERRVGELDT